MTTGVVGGNLNIHSSQLVRNRLFTSSSGHPHTCSRITTGRQRIGTCSQRPILQSWPSFPRQAERQQVLLRNRRRSLTPAAISADAGIPVVGPKQAEAEPVQSRGLGSLTSRIVSGSILGLGGGLVILAGGWIFTIATCLVAYQATQEFYGFVTSKASTVHDCAPYWTVCNQILQRVLQFLLRGYVDNDG